MTWRATCDGDRRTLIGTAATRVEALKLVQPFPAHPMARLTDDDSGEEWLRIGDHWTQSIAPGARAARAARAAREPAFDLDQGFATPPPAGDDDTTTDGGEG